MVKAEYKIAVDKLISIYHCSRKQATGSVIVVANELFGRNWKFPNEGSIIDMDTAPQLKFTRESGKSIGKFYRQKFFPLNYLGVSVRLSKIDFTFNLNLEIIALKGIAEEIMRGDDVVITWHDDGSKKKSVGSFCVNGITIDGVYRALPTLSVATETCQEKTRST